MKPFSLERRKLYGRDIEIESDQPNELKVVKQDQSGPLKVITPSGTAEAQARRKDLLRRAQESLKKSERY